MGDMREKQLNEKELDYTNDTKGIYSYTCKLQVWPYSSIKNEDCYSRHVTIKCNAENIVSALRFCDCIAHAIKQGHDVWECHITSVSQS